MKNSNQLKLVQLVSAFMDDLTINAARHTSEAANALAEQIEHLLTTEGFYDDQGEDAFPPLTPAEMGRRGGSVKSEAKKKAAQANIAKRWAKKPEENS